MRDKIEDENEEDGSSATYTSQPVRKNYFSPFSLLGLRIDLDVQSLELFFDGRALWYSRLLSLLPLGLSLNHRLAWLGRRPTPIPLSAKELSPLPLLPLYQLLIFMTASSTFPSIHTVNDVCYTLPREKGHTFRCSKVATWCGS